MTQGRRFCCSYLQCFCKVVLVLRELLCTNIVVLFVHLLRRDGPCSGDSGPIYILQSHGGYFPGLVVAVMSGGCIGSPPPLETLWPWILAPAPAGGCCTPRRDGQGRRGHTAGRAQRPGQGWPVWPCSAELPGAREREDSPIGIASFKRFPPLDSVPLILNSLSVVC